MHTRECLSALQESFSSFETNFADDKVDWDVKSVNSHYLQAANQKFEHADFLLKDSGALEILKCLAPNPKLRPSLNNIFMTEAFPTGLIDHCQHIKKSGDEASWQAICTATQQLRNQGEELAPSANDVDSEAGRVCSACVEWCQMLRARMKEHEAALAEISKQIKIVCQKQACRAGHTGAGSCRIDDFA